MENNQSDFKCDKCKGKFSRKGNRASKTWSMVNKVSYGTTNELDKETKKTKYQGLCRPCLISGYEKERNNFIEVVPITQRKLFQRYRYNGIFDKSEARI